MGLSEAGSPTNQNRARAETYQSFIQLPCDRATKTLRGVTAAWIQDQRVIIKDGKAVEYQVNLKITFVLEG
jgi:dodecin